jgi:hypothetical protein
MSLVEAFRSGTCAVAQSTYSYSGRNDREVIVENISLPQSPTNATYVEPSSETILEPGLKLGDLLRRNMTQPYVLAAAQKARVVGAVVQLRHRLLRGRAAAC